ncbi:unnamed protein product [Moneuplotes crassus]|uniref:Uncharacterized protein n=1 Tax=Euplotes crassus TaxID=5936 RepID=A0AAD1UNR8_EUPCR|nr:unnamed protein product [Moneuplotes crassus]
MFRTVAAGASVLVIGISSVILFKAYQSDEAAEFLLYFLILYVFGFPGTVIFISFLVLLLFRMESPRMMMVPQTPGNMEVPMMYNFHPNLKFIQKPQDCGSLLV